MPESFGDVSVVCERKLVPSIDVSIHPTIEIAPPVKEKEKEVDTIQEEVEKSLGLKITGGVDFKMPITIFHVKDDSKAKRVGLKLGDSIAYIEDKETKLMTLREAIEALLHASKNIRSFRLGVVRFQDEEVLKGKEVSSIEEVVMEGNPKAPRFLVEPHIEPPREAYAQHPERKAWHPIMWPHPEYFLPENYHEELPHKRIVRNVRKMLESKPSRVELENILTALPRGSRPKRNYEDDSD